MNKAKVQLDYPSPMRTVYVAAAALVVVLILLASILVAAPSVLSSGKKSQPTSLSLPPSLFSSTGSAAGSQTTSAVRGSGGADWTTYHTNNDRTAYLPYANFTSVTQSWTSPTLDGLVFAEPLVYGVDVFVATENNSVYALSAQSGEVIWRTNLGTPVDSSTLPCGDIVPVTGITGTPVIDPSTGILYVVSFDRRTFGHFLNAINVSDGAVVFRRPADPQGSNVMVEQERSALSLANGMVYIPYGGLAGDCGQYNGLVVGLPENGTGNMVLYRVPTSREGGIWAPSGAAVDSSGNVYIATGNGASITTYDHGDSVIALSPTLVEQGNFAPTNWSVLNQNDVDIGSVGPAIVGPNLLFIIGKEGVGYLLNSSNLGGIGGQNFEANVCNESFGGTAFANSTIFVPCINGLFELDLVNSTFFSTRLEVAGFNAGPPIVTGGVVWSVDDNSGTLYGLSVATGHEAYSFSLGSVEHFTTPAAGDGHLFVAAADEVISFVLG